VLGTAVEVIFDGILLVQAAIYPHKAPMEYEKIEDDIDIDEIDIK